MGLNTVRLGNIAISYREAKANGIYSEEPRYIGKIESQRAIQNVIKKIVKKNTEGHKNS